MTRLACYLITALFYFINGVDCLVRCNNVTTIKSFTRFPPVSVICDHIEMQLFSESFVYFIETDFFTETCTYSLLTKAYISENFIIAVENKTVYRRGPDAHTIRLSCIPEKAEYLTGGIYFLIQRLPNKVTQFKLEKEYRKSVCEHFLNEAAQYSSDESSNEDTVKFIRRATNSEGLTGIFIDGRINYIQCDIVDLPIKNMSIIESECFNGTKVRTNDGQTWYTYNGLDIIDEDKVKGCLESVPYSVIMSLEKNITKKEENILEGSTNYIMVSNDTFNKNDYVPLLKDKINSLFKTLLNFDVIELSIMFIVLSIFYAVFWWCIFGCFTTCCFNRRIKRHNSSFVSYV